MQSDLTQRGALHLPSTAAPVLPILRQLAEGCGADQPGVRLTGSPVLRQLLAESSPISAVARSLQGPAARPVRAILFDKRPGLNWSLGWHQDRVIAVCEEAEVPGYGPWTRKDSILHVAPPTELLGRMLTLRIHLDPTGPDNAPLLIAPGSHRLGRVAEQDIDAVVQRCGIQACLADAGDLWVYATLILHASERARIDARRRVLQLDYSADELPAPLQWLGV